MSVKGEFYGFNNQLEEFYREAIFEDGYLDVGNRSESMGIYLTPQMAISLASKLLQYGTQAYRYPKKSDD